MSLPRQARPSPPVDFPVYGLAESWPGTRWLESFGDAIGDPVRWVSLGHLGPDGASVTARAWRFAGGWAAFGAAVDDVYLVVTGVGIRPGVLPLARVADGGPYHFRLDQPLHPRVMAASRAARAGGDELPWPRREQWHDDQPRVLPPP